MEYETKYKLKNVLVLKVTLFTLTNGTKHGGRSLQWQKKKIPAIHSATRHAVTHSGWDHVFLMNEGEDEKRSQKEIKFKYDEITMKSLWNFEKSYKCRKSYICLQY